MYPNCGIGVLHCLSSASKALKGASCSVLRGCLLRSPDTWRVPGWETVVTRYATMRGDREIDIKDIDDAPKIFVGNLPFSIRARELGQHFACCGKVVAVDVIQDSQTGRSKGYGFVEFADFTSMDKAIDEMNGTVFEGNHLKVNRAKKQGARGEARGAEHGGRGGYGDRGGGYGDRGDRGGGYGDRGDRGSGYGDRGGSYGDRGGGGYGDRGADRGGYEERRGGTDRFGGDREPGGARGLGGYDSGRRDAWGGESRGPAKPEGFRLTIKGLPPDAKWTDLKDFLRHAGSVTYANVQADGVGVGEYSTAEECLEAIRMLDGTPLLGSKVWLFPLNFDQRTRQKLDAVTSSVRGGSNSSYPAGGTGASYGRSDGPSQPAAGGERHYDSRPAGAGVGRDSGYSRHDNDRAGGGGGYNSRGPAPGAGGSRYDHGGGGGGAGGGSYRDGGYVASGARDSYQRAPDSRSPAGPPRDRGAPAPARDYDRPGFGPDRRHDDGYSRPRPYQGR